MQQIRYITVYIYNWCWECRNSRLFEFRMCMLTCMDRARVFHAVQVKFKPKAETRIGFKTKKPYSPSTGVLCIEYDGPLHAAHPASQNHSVMSADSYILAVFGKCFRVTRE